MPMFGTTKVQFFWNKTVINDSNEKSSNCSIIWHQKPLFQMQVNSEAETGRFFKNGRFWASSVKIRDPEGNFSVRYLVETRECCSLAWWNRVFWRVACAEIVLSSTSILNTGLCPTALHGGSSRTMSNVDGGNGGVSVVSQQEFSVLAAPEGRLSPVSRHNFVES